MILIHHKTPSLDLHGEESALVYPLVTEFINDNYNMSNYVVRIIHGKSTNILTREVHTVLKMNKLVKKFKLNPWNLGETLVEINTKG